MKLSISNIGWDACNDASVFGLMKKYGYSGLEIAPTRIFLESPYERLDEAKAWVEDLKNEEGFIVPSIQSIWFGRQEKIFGTEEERQILVDYTKKAIDFAETIGCGNIVFGCPRNRNMPEGVDENIAISFFKEIGDYAAEHNTVIGMEANPPIYNTNYINDTKSAFKLIEKVDSSGFKLNLDVGTMIQNSESAEELAGNVYLINHVHISEPGLKIIAQREIHKKIKGILVNEGYHKFISVEMGKGNDYLEIECVLRYVSNVFLQ